MVVSMSWRRGAFIVFFFFVFLVEWNIGASMAVEQQVVAFGWIAFWGALFTLLAFLPFDEREFRGEGFSYKCSAVSCIQQGVLLIIGLYIAYGRRDMSMTFDEYLTSDAGSPAMALERQVHYLCAAGMIKDFWLPDDLTPAFVLHHVLAVIGSGMCLSLPVGFGAATLNSFQAEVTSCTFNLMFCVPGPRPFRKALQALYFVLMIFSHIKGYIIGRLFAETFVHRGGSSWWTWWRSMYVSLCTLLVLFRLVGHVLYGKKLFSDWIPELESADEAAARATSRSTNGKVDKKKL